MLLLVPLRYESFFFKPICMFISDDFVKGVLLLTCIKYVYFCSLLHSVSESCEYFRIFLSSSLGYSVVSMNIFFLNGRAYCFLAV